MGGADVFASMLGVRRSLDQYRTCVGGQSVEEIAELAKPLRGSRILQLSAMPSRPGVSDTLDSLTSLLRLVGIAAEWRIVPSKPHQIEVYRALNLALSGHFVQWTPQMHMTWLSHDAALADFLSQDYEFVVVHDAVW